EPVGGQVPVGVGRRAPRALLLADPLDQFANAVFKLIRRLIAKSCADTADVRETVAYIACPKFSQDFEASGPIQLLRQELRYLKDAGWAAGAAGDHLVVGGRVRHRQPTFLAGVP